jgi:hypothetical protein
LLFTEFWIKISVSFENVAKSVQCTMMGALAELESARLEVPKPNDGADLL